MTTFSAEELIGTAIKRTGANDFGEPELSEGLDALVRGINKNDNIVYDRTFMLREELLRFLTNRLLRTKDISENPDILDQPVLSPTVIVSLPRTGSTKLQQVMEATGHFFQTQCWQLHKPGRIPGEAEAGEAQRFAETKKFYDWRKQVSPDFHRLHSIYPDKADEETVILKETFNYPSLGMLFSSDDYLRWVAKRDPGSSFDYLLTQLKYLQWQFHRNHPRPWLLKSPEFLGYEKQLTRIFPKDLRIIFLHRDPVEIIPSATKLMEATKNLYYDHPPQNRQACEEILGWTTIAIKQHLKWRDANPQVKTLDLSFKEVTNDSIRTCQRICDFTGVEFTDEMTHRIEQWDQDNPRYKHGKAEYSLADYGMNEAEVNEMFSDYLNRFGEYI